MSSLQLPLICVQMYMIKIIPFSITRMDQKRKLAVHKHQVGYWKGHGDKNEFVGLTNFTM